MENVDALHDVSRCVAEEGIMSRTTGAYNDNDATGHVADGSKYADMNGVSGANVADEGHTMPGVVKGHSPVAVDVGESAEYGRSACDMLGSDASTDSSLNGRARHSRRARQAHARKVNAHRRSGSLAFARDKVDGFASCRGYVWVIFAVIVVVAIILVGGVKRQASRTQKVGKQADTVTVGLKLAPTNLDIRNQSGSSLDQALIGNVYQGLVARNARNEVVPAIAKSWVKSPDGKSYVFHLNDGLTFSNGDELDADDVVWSINELMRNNYTGADTLFNFKSITVLDKLTVRLDLTQPYSNLLWALSGRAGLVLDEDAGIDMKTQAMGSGPYAVAQFVPNDSLTLKVNRRYHGPDKARTPTIVLRYFANDNAAVNALKSGDVQVLAPIAQNLAIPFAHDSEHYTVASGEATDKFVLAMNCRGKNTSNTHVRQAIRYAINHKELIASRGAVDKPLGGPIPGLDPGYEDLTGVYPYDPSKAKNLMKRAGYTPEHPLKLTLTYANAYGTELGDQLRSQLRPIGIDLKVNMVEFSTWLEDVFGNHDYDLSVVDHNESHDFAQWANPDYYYNYNNPEVRTLYWQAMTSLTDQGRDECLRRAARKVSQDAPADWLFNYRATTVMEKGVKCFPFNLNQTLLRLSEVTYTPQS
jgi:peptide/nickel transport system substrate-binding protein